MFFKKKKEEPKKVEIKYTVFFYSFDDSEPLRCKGFMENEKALSSEITDILEYRKMFYVLTLDNTRTIIRTEDVKSIEVHPIEVASDEV
jgi:hypothetical protein